MKSIIAFAGRKQSGKTTCAEFVAECFNKTGLSEEYHKNTRYNGSLVNYNKAKVYNFADPLKKDICMNILGLTYDQCYGSDDKKNELVNCYWENKQLTAREVMQFVGTDIFRKIQNNVWADATINKITSESYGLAIIADCRFPNEVEAVKNAGGFVVKLNRNPFNSDHSSETALDSTNYSYTNFDLILSNESMTIDQQNKSVYDFLIKNNII